MWRSRSLILLTALSSAGLTQTLRQPDLAAQRAAMKKLAFLEGKWSGEARVWRGSPDPIEIRQTEEARFALDGLVLLIEGFGDAKADGQPMIRALGFVSFDDEKGVYRMRAFNDGRYLETELAVATEGQGASWGFVLGNLRTRSVLRINTAGEWTESHELTIADQPPRKLMEVRVKRSGRSER